MYASLTASPTEVFDQLRHLPGAVWLDDGRSEAGWSILSFAPTEVLTAADDWPRHARALLEGLDDSDSDLPFTGGLIGYVGYEAAHAVGPFPTAGTTPEPPVHLGLYEGAMCFDRSQRRWHLTGPPAFVEQARAALAAARSLPSPPPPPDGVTTRTMSQSAFEAAVRTIKGHIFEGDCYQLNMTRAVHLQGIDAPWSVYRRLRRLSRPAYGAYLNLVNGCTVLSNSPEAFLAFDGRQVRTTPIKGTRPRHDDPIADAQARHELMTSDKELAELTMIVDLCRNDLGMVAAPGSVVTSARELTTHANVHHTAQTVRATLADGRDALDALAAAFPPGSVTGAPKIRACQRIAELEAGPRGVYCGAIGYLSAHGRGRWSVAIRTAVCQGDRARYHVGGGIVADSDPTAEWVETIDKGTMLASAFTGRRRPEESEGRRRPVG